MTKSLQTEKDNNHPSLMKIINHQVINRKKEVFLTEWPIKNNQGQSTTKREKSKNKLKISP